MSMAIFTTLSAAGIFEQLPPKGDQLMLSLWGILVGGPSLPAGPRLYCCCHWCTAACWPPCLLLC